MLVISQGFTHPQECIINVSVLSVRNRKLIVVRVDGELDY